MPYSNLLGGETSFTRSCFLVWQDAQLLIWLGDIELSNEVFMRNHEHYSVAGRETRFRNEIHARDKKCVISGLTNPDENISHGIWPGLHAAHIFPLMFENLWNQFGYSKWITDIDNDTRSRTINSAQNGFLLRKSIHTIFDQFLLSVNPDDGFKVVVFGNNFEGNDGKILDPACHHPADLHGVTTHLQCSQRARPARLR